MQFHNGDRYEGEWSMSKFSGRGKLTKANGDSYDGAWLCGMRNGFGLEVKQHGDYVYQGAFVNDLRHGYGVLKRLEPSATSDDAKYVEY